MVLKEKAVGSAVRLCMTLGAVVFSALGAGNTASAAPEIDELTRSLSTPKPAGPDDAVVITICPAVSLLTTLLLTIPPLATTLNNEDVSTAMPAW